MFEVTYFSGKYHSFYRHLLALMTFMQVFCTLEATCIVLKMSTFNAIFLRDTFSCYKLCNLLLKLFEGFCPAKNTQKCVLVYIQNKIEHSR